MRRRYPKPHRCDCDDCVQQWRIGVLERDAAIPEREPGQVVPVRDHIAADGDVGPLNGAHELAVFERKQLFYEIEVEREDHGRESKRLQPSGHVAPHKWKLLTTKYTTGR